MTDVDTDESGDTLRVMITGSRDWTNAAAVRSALLRLDRERPVTIIHGGAKGADSIAAEYAKRYGYAIEKYPAQWRVHGKAAGPIRNRQMLDTGIDRVLAFHKDGSRGTADAIAEAKRRGIHVECWEDTYE